MTRWKPRDFTAGVPLGGIIPRRLKDDAGFIMLSRPGSPVAEGYRRLAGKLEQNPDSPTLRTIVVTSATGGEGKTVTAVNLAMALAEGGAGKVVLVDWDMRRPALSATITPPAKLGVRDVLAGKAPLEHALVHLKDCGLSVVPAGEPIRNPRTLLQIEPATRLVNELRGRFKHVVIDTPPVVPFTDASLLGHIADGVLIVVRAGRTAKPTLDRALQLLEGSRVLGAVLNDTKSTPVDRYYYYYDERDPDRPAAGGSKGKRRKRG